MHDLWRRNRTNACPLCGDIIETPVQATVDYVRPMRDGDDARMLTRLAHTWCQPRQRTNGRGG